MARKTSADREKASVAVVARRSNCREYLPLLNLGERTEKYAQVDPAEFSPALRFELVLLDLGLEAEYGVQLLRELKRNRPAVPVIVLASASSEELAVTCFRAGARDYLRKPINVFEVKKKVDELLRVSRGAGEKRSALTSGAGRAGEPFGEPQAQGSELPERVLRVVRYMERNFCSEIYLDSLAKNACLSKYHFCRTFKSHLGMTPMQYLSLLRVQRAKLLLQNADLSVSMVALHSGFSDTSDFIRNFKKVIGLTPYAYKTSQASQSSLSSRGSLLQPLSHGLTPSLEISSD